MVSTLLHFLLFGIITLVNGNQHYFNERAVGLIPKLSNLKGKYGLNFAHVEGISSLPKHYKESHPKLTYMDQNPKKRDKSKPADFNNIEMYNLLVAAKTKDIARSRDYYCDKADENTREVLRICRKKPKEYQCRPEKECGEASESSSSSESKEESESDEANESKKKRRYSIKKNLYFRTDNAEAHEAVDETAILLNDLENLLARNDKYRVLLGCVGRMCVGRKSREGYIEDGDDTKVRREYFGCIGDRCGRSRDDGGDIDVRRYQRS